jgi:hypothetical protein
MGDAGAGGLCIGCLQQAIDESAASLKGDATPGVPWMKYAATNSQVLRVVGDVLKKSVENRILGILSQGEKIFEMSPQELVENNVCSPIRLFVKDEPHKEIKVLAGMFRLISGVAVDDQMIDRLLYKAQNNREIDSWEQCVSKPGIGLDDDGLKIMGKFFQDILSEHGELTSIDIKAWDWSVQGWELEAEAELRRRLAESSCDSTWHFLNRVRCYAISHKVFALPNGELIAQKGDFGIMASGWLNTSSSNSHIGALLDAIITVEEHCENGGTIENFDYEQSLCAAIMGDDKVRKRVTEAYLRKMEELGHTVKEFEHFKKLEGVEFCSHKWMPNGLAWPLNKGKTLFRFKIYQNRYTCSQECVFRIFW